MDNRMIYVQQAVDTIVVIQVEDENGSLLSVGWQDDARAEVHFCRASGALVGKLSSSMGHVRFVPGAPGVPEAMYLTFEGEATQTWALEPEQTDIRFDENDSQVVMGTEVLYGTLLIRDASGVDIPNASGGNLAVVMESSTTLGFTASTIGDDYKGEDAA